MQRTAFESRKKTRSNGSRPHSDGWQDKILTSRQFFLDVYRLVGWVGCSGTPGRGLRDTPTGGQAEDTRAAGEQDLGCNRTTELVTGVQAALLTGRPPRGQGGGEAGWCQDPRARGHRSCARAGDRTPARPAAGSPNWSTSGRKRLSRVKIFFN